MQPRKRLTIIWSLHEKVNVIFGRFRRKDIQDFVRSAELHSDIYEFIAVFGDSIGYPIGKVFFGIHGLGILELSMKSQL
jgi:hypothetical protein